MFDEPPEFSFPQGAKVAFEGIDVPVRNLWDARTSQVGIFHREDLHGAFMVALQFASGRCVCLGQYPSFSAAFASINGGQQFDPAHEEGNS